MRAHPVPAGDESVSPLIREDRRGIG